jgi:DNA-binding HxlR family transcriptional regulator
MIINNKEFVIQIENQRFHCAMDVSMKYIGGKWKSVVLWYLRKESKRFAMLKKLIPQITERMLSITLQQLEKDGLVKREVFMSKPPLKVEYSLTDFGKSLLPALEALAQWGREVSKQKGEIIEVKND